MNNKPLIGHYGFDTFKSVKSCDKLDLVNEQIKSYNSEVKRILHLYPLSTRHLKKRNKDSLNEIEKELLYWERKSIEYNRDWRKFRNSFLPSLSSEQRDELLMIACAYRDYREFKRIQEIL